MFRCENIILSFRTQSKFPINTPQFEFSFRDFFQNEYSSPSKYLNIRIREII